MPVSIEIDVSGLEKLDGRLKAFERQIDATLRGAMQESTELVRATIADYPPETAANRPPGVDGYSWYERGFGTRTVTGLSYGTSEQLGRSWNTRIKGSFFGGSVEGTVGTEASYGPYVHDPDQQARIHTLRGWPTTTEVLERRADDVRGIFNRAVDVLLSRLGLR